MTESIAKVNEQGRIEIPIQLSQHLGLVAGSKTISFCSWLQIMGIPI